MDQLVRFDHDARRISFSGIVKNTKKIKLLWSFTAAIHKIEARAAVKQIPGFHVVVEVVRSDAGYASYQRNCPG